MHLNNYLSLMKPRTLKLNEKIKMKNKCTHFQMFCVNRWYINSIEMIFKINFDDDRIILPTCEKLNFNRTRFNFFLSFVSRSPLFVYFYYHYYYSFTMEMSSIVDSIDRSMVLTCSMLQVHRSHSTVNRISVRKIR